MTASSARRASRVDAGALAVVGPHDQPPADPGRVGVLDDGRHGDRATGLDVVGDLTELGEGLLVDLLDVDVEDAAAGQPDRERVVVADAVPLEHGVAARRPRTGASS